MPMVRRTKLRITSNHKTWLTSVISPTRSA